MREAPESWGDLAGRLAHTRFGDVRHFAEIDSTNRYLLDEARAGAPEGVVAVADFQTAGRGRLGRAWVAPPGSSLLVSALLRPAVDPALVHLVTMVGGLATADAVFLGAGFSPSLKWPNDLVVGDRKLAGMLSEADLRGGDVQAVVVGIGLNVEWHELPEEIEATATACNLVAGRAVDRADLLVRLLERLDARYGHLGEPGGPEATVGEYRQRCSTLGRRVRVERPDGASEGLARDVDDLGRLVVEGDDGSTKPVAAADVVHLRPEPFT